MSGKHLLLIAIPHSVVGAFSNCCPCGIGGAAYAFELEVGTPSAVRTFTPILALLYSLRRFVLELGALWNGRTDKTSNAAY